MKQIHKFTSDDKIKWFGYGEWAEEPDAVFFEHEDIECKCVRVVRYEKSGYAFGGHWCGYIKVPDGHQWHGHSFEYDFDCDVHGGITYGQSEEDGWWIGFDCAHSGDLVPSMENLYNTDQAYKKIREDHQNRVNKFKLDMSMFQEHYRNINYVVQETKNLAKKCAEVRECGEQLPK